MADEAETTTGAVTPEQAPTDGAATSSGAGRFTQEDVNRMISERLSRSEKAAEKKLVEATESAIAAFREERGLTDDVISKIATVDSEKLALKNEVKQLKKLHTELESRHGSAAERLRSLLVDESVIKVAAPVAANGDVEPILALLKPRVRVDEKEWKVYVVDDKGEPTGESIEDAVKNLIEKKPQLAAAAGRYGTGSQPRAPGATRSNSSEDTPERRMAILGKAFGR